MMIGQLTCVACVLATPCHDRRDIARSLRDPVRVDAAVKQTVVLG